MAAVRIQVGLCAGFFTYLFNCVSKEANNMPQSFLDFRNENSIELVRIANGAWKDVDEHVKVGDRNGRQRIVVCGRPHGRTRTHKLLSGASIQVEIITNSPVQFKLWVNQIRKRIAPWKFLEEVKDMNYCVLSCGAEEIERKRGGFVTGRIAAEVSLVSVNQVEEKQIDDLGALPEQIEKASVLDHLIAHDTASVETCAAFFKLVAEHLADSAEVVGDLAKCVTGLSPIFHLAVLEAQGMSKCAEASRRRRVLIDLQHQILVLSQYTLESMTQIMKSSRSMNKTDSDFVFGIYRKAVGAMDTAEEQFLRGRDSQV